MKQGSRPLGPNASKIGLQPKSERETRALGRALAALLAPGDVVALQGPLGSGKTTFVRGVAEGLGIEPGEVSSPSFLICHEYGGQPTPLVHIDAYRLSGEADLQTIGFEDLLARGDSVVIVEWADRIAAALPEERLEISFAHAGETSRALVVSGPARIVDRLRGLVGSGPCEGPAGCPICGQAVDADAELFPFCSRRCRNVDLGRWFEESYRVEES